MASQSGSGSESESGSEDEGGDHTNHYCSQAMSQAEFTDDSEADSDVEGGGPIDAAASASQVSTAFANLKKSMCVLFAAVAVNMFVMDACAAGDDAELREKSKNVTVWVNHMISLEPEFLSYPQYRCARCCVARGWLSAALVAVPPHCFTSPPRPPPTSFSPFRLLSPPFHYSKFRKLVRGLFSAYPFVFEHVGEQDFDAYIKVCVT